MFARLGMGSDGSGGKQRKLHGRDRAARVCGCTKMREPRG
jgi:hypothetical protein